MPEGPDIQIPIITTGDTAGAEKVEKSIMGVQTAEKALQQQSDLATVKGRQAAEVQNQQAQSLRNIADGQKLLLAAQFAEVVSKIAGEFKGLNENVDLGIEQFNDFSQTLATTGNIYAAVGALITTEVSQYMRALHDAADQEKQIAKEQVENHKRVADSRRDNAFLDSQEKIIEVYQRELAAIQQIAEAHERLRKVRASENELAVARQNAAVDAAVAGGASAEGGAALKLDAATKGSIADINLAQQAEQDALNAIADKATELQGKAQNLALNTEAQKAAQKEAEKAAGDAEKAALDFAANNEVRANKIREIILAASTSAAEIGTQSTEAIKTSAEKEVAAIKAAAERSGGRLSSSAKEALDGLEKILADGVVKPEEIGRLQEAMARIHASREGADAEVAKGLNLMATNTDAFLQIVKPMMQKMAGQAQELADLKSALQQQGIIR